MSKLSMLLVAGAAIGALTGAVDVRSALAAEPAQATAAAGPVARDSKVEGAVLEEVVVTGSLIPQKAAEATAPAVMITAEDLQVRGYSTIADALQQSTFSTGSVQGPQFAGFTQGAKTLSLFGLSPSYVKYLIDGLPMADYPALYNGTDTFTSIGGIPMALVERIDILPGGQSSLYGSDAIAGVINIVLKKKVEGLQADLRYDAYGAGGGTDRMVAIADGFTSGDLNLMAGFQYDKSDPIWGFQRGITSQYYAAGASPQTAERTYLVFGLFGQNPDGSNDYYFEDPSNCANSSAGYGGTIALQSRPGRGQYCGSVRSGYYTLNNGDESAQGYLRATYAVSPAAELYGDLLLSNEVAKFSSNGGGVFNSTYDPNIPYYYYFDPNLNDLMNLQHVFTPEEVGNLERELSSATTNLYRATFGVRGSLTESWSYDANVTYNTQKLTESTFVLLTHPLVAFYAPMFGPSLDPTTPTYTPDYSQFYKPLTPAQYASLSGDFVNHSRTENSLFRGQVTNSALFHAPGGDAGLALVLEGGRQSWDYYIDPGFATDNFFGYTSSGDSAGRRTRWAATSELRVPLHRMLTATLSGRYDDYHIEGGHIDKSTYMFGVEFKPVHSVMVRGRVGTAFKAPTLSDLFQGKSGYYVGATDYYQCALAGKTGAQLPQCQYYVGNNYSVFGQTSGNAALRPINADVWNGGIVFTPLKRLSIDIDYLHWNIKDEVTQQNSDQLLRDESACRLGTLDPNSPTCVAALQQVVRDANNQIVSIYTPKVNVSKEREDALSVNVNYIADAGRVGQFRIEAAWTDILKHKEQIYAGDPVIDLVRDPFWSTDFKTKINGSVTWDKDRWTSTLYVTRVGRTPNNQATLDPTGYAQPGAGTLAAWTRANLHVGYQLTDGLEISAGVNNMSNAMPPVDHSYFGSTGQPYNIFNYDAFGRSYRLEVSYKGSK